MRHRVAVHIAHNKVGSHTATSLIFCSQLLIYLILYISDCLSKIASAKVPMSQNEAVKQLSTLAVDNFSLPGDAGFPLNNLYSPPATRQEAGTLTSDVHDGRRLQFNPLFALGRLLI